MQTTCRPRVARARQRGLRKRVFFTFLATVVVGPAVVQAGAYSVLEGAHVEIHCPSAQAELGRKLVTMADKALVLYADYFGAAVPDDRIRCYLYATVDEYVAEEAKRTKGVFKTNLAFTHARTADVLMVFQPRVDRLQTDGPGMLEALLMHELAHALQYKLFPTYDHQPDWLSEGVAELLSELALGNGERCAHKTPWFAAWAYGVLEAADQGEFVPIRKLLTEGLTGTNAHVRQIKYGEAWALCRYLDDPAEPDRQRRFRQFLGAVSNLESKTTVRTETAKRFHALWPDPQALERSVLRTLRAEIADYLPWHMLVRELRVNNDGSLVCESFPQRSALALSTSPPLPILARISADVDIRPGRSQQADIFFAYRNSTDFYKIALGAKNDRSYITLMHHGEKWVTVANKNLEAKALLPGRSHKVEIDIDVGRLVVRIDGKKLLKFRFKNSSFGKGRWGIGAYNSAVVYRNVRGQGF